MINVVCKNLKELQNALQDKIDYALLTDVSHTVTEVMTDHIARDVYDVYLPIDITNPHQYVRREDNGGLIDPNNINSSIEKNVLIVENNTLGAPEYGIGNEVFSSQNKDKEIAGVIETGKGYDIHGWEYDGVPRPFIQNTREDLKNNKYHVIALRQGLKKQGLEVE